ncbi:energy transducer TonB [Brucella intermedia]|nr:energy transducer TonB [Brucella intermedia]
MLRRTRYLKRQLGKDAKGTLQLQIVVDPSGNILSAKLAASSGNPKLDQLALEAAKRASPLPAPPPALAEPRKAVLLPMKFE